MARKSQPERVRVVDDMGRPTPERLRHAGRDYEVADGRGSAGTMTMRDVPIERALKRGQIGGKEYQAGLKFRHHWWHGGMAGQIKSLDLNQVFARDLAGMGHMAKTEAPSVKITRLAAVSVREAKMRNGISGRRARLSRTTSRRMSARLLTAIAPKIHGWTDLFGTEEFLFLLVFIWLLIQGPGPVSLDNVIVGKRK